MNPKLGWTACVLAVAVVFCAEASTTVLCSTFPIYQIARNVADGRGGIEIELLLPASMGCPHHYALTPMEMRILSRADILVVNGLGMEEFLGAPLMEANPNVVVLDASKGIEGLIFGGVDGHGEEECDHEGQGHAHSGANPHLFASPRMSSLLAQNIAAGLAAADPDGVETYLSNASAYAGRMKTLADELSDLGQALKNRRIVQPHGAFDYFARDAGLEIVAVLQPHGGEPSAAEMLEVIRIAREKSAGAVFTEPQYSSKAGRTVAREAGIPAAMLDPGASGPERAPLDYFDALVRRNMETLVETIGTK